MNSFIDYKLKQSEENLIYEFDIKEDHDEIFLDILFKGIQEYGTSVNVSIASFNSAFKYESSVRVCRETGLFIGISPCPAEKYYLKIEKDVLTLESIFLHTDADNVCNYQISSSQQTGKNKKYTEQFSKKINKNITWFVTWLCNYKCPYCWERLDESKYRKELNSINSVSPQKWAEAFNKLSPDELYLTGGEPTIYNALPEVIKELNGGIMLRMTTNFGSTFNVDKYAEIVKEGRFKELFASFHPSELSAEEFMDKIEYALSLNYDKHCIFGIEFVLYPDDLEYGDILLDFAKGKNIVIKMDNYSDPKSKYRPGSVEITRINNLQKRCIEHNSKLKKGHSNDLRYFEIEKDSTSDTVICGAGVRGQELAARITKGNHGDQLKCFADNQIGKKGINKMGKPVFSIQDAVCRFKNANFVIAIDNKLASASVALQLAECGVSRKQILFTQNIEFIPNDIIRGKQPIWCPAGMSTLHVDPKGDVYKCMVALNNAKMFGRNTTPNYKPLFNMLSDDVNSGSFMNSASICWESFRCSACDYDLLAHGMTNMELKDNCTRFPLPE